MLSSIATSLKASTRASRIGTEMALRVAGLFKTTAKVESQAFAQHEAVSRNYDTLLERYMALVDETKRLKREIKDALPGSAGAAPLY